MARLSCQGYIFFQAIIYIKKNYFELFAMTERPGRATVGKDRKKNLPPK